MVENSDLVSFQTPAFGADNPSSTPGTIPLTSTLETPARTISVRKSQPLVKRIKRLRTDEYTTSMLEIERKKLDLLVQKNEKKRSNDPEDEDWPFFKSILPHVKKIRPERILAFRGRIQELVQEFAYPTSYFQIQPLHSIRSPTPSSSSVSTIQRLPPENDSPFTKGTFNFLENQYQ